MTAAVISRLAALRAKQAVWDAKAKAWLAAAAKQLARK